MVQTVHSAEDVMLHSCHWMLCFLRREGLCFRKMDNLIRVVFIRIFSTRTKNGFSAFTGSVPAAEDVVDDFFFCFPFLFLPSAEIVVFAVRGVVGVVEAIVARVVAAVVVAVAVVGPAGRRNRKGWKRWEGLRVYVHVHRGHLLRGE